MELWGILVKHAVTISIKRVRVLATLLTLLQFSWLLVDHFLLPAEIWDTPLIYRSGLAGLLLLVIVGDRRAITCHFLN